ncbi:MAG: hypothetical protein ACRD3S_10670, partial [Terracidiphilus sp.]
MAEEAEGILVTFDKALGGRGANFLIGKGSQGSRRPYGAADRASRRANLDLSLGRNEGLGLCFPTRPAKGAGWMGHRAPGGYR